MKSNHFNFNLFFASALALLYFIYSAVLSPIYIRICSDVILLESNLPYILEMLLEICQLFIWAHLFSHMLRAVKSKKITFYVVFTVVFTLARYLFNPIVNITKGVALDLADVLDSLMYFGADILILAVVFLLMFFRKNKVGNDYCRFGALSSALLLSASKIITRIIFDVFYGAPQSFSEIFVMILYYFFDVLYGVAAYFLIYFLSRSLLKKKNSF